MISNRHEDFLYDKAAQKIWQINGPVLLKKEVIDYCIPLIDWHEAKPSKWISDPANGRCVDGATYWPGREQIIEDVSIEKYGPVRRDGHRLFNTYCPSRFAYASGTSVEPWTKHIRSIMTESDADLFFDFFAHLIQRPGEAAPFAIAIAGPSCIGKDAALSPIKRAVGSGNMAHFMIGNSTREIDAHAHHLLKIIEPKSINMRIRQFIELPTLLTKAKYERPRRSPNLSRVVIVGWDMKKLRIPDVYSRIRKIQCTARIDWAPKGYFKELFAWYEGGGHDAVAGWLSERNLPRGIDA